MIEPVRWSRTGALLAEGSGDRFRALLGAMAIALGVTGISATDAIAQLSPEPRTYDAPRAASPPTIDGTLDDPAWRAAAWTEPFIDIRGTEWPEPAWETRAKITWDHNHLYVAAELEEPHLWATLADRDAILYREHDFEVFIDPDGDALDYYELEINALGTEFDLFLPRPYNRKGKANVGWDMVGLRTAVALDGTLNDPSDDDRGWTVEIAIPWSALRPPAGGSASDDPRETDRYATVAEGRHRAGAGPRVGDEWRINFSRVQWPVEVVPGGYRRAKEPGPEDRHPEHNWVWSPQGEINMHVPEKWGIVRFRQEAGSPGNESPVDADGNPSGPDTRSSWSASR